MKNLVLIIIVALFWGCNQKIYTGEVNFISKDGQGTITLRSVGYGKTTDCAIINAQQNAFRIILFKGIPGTDVTIPIIENESEAKLKNPEYFKKFLDEGNYLNFIMASSPSANLTIIKKNICKKTGNIRTSVEIKINLFSLRKDLEQNKIIRKFGL